MSADGTKRGRGWGDDNHSPSPAALRRTDDLMGGRAHKRNKIVKMFLLFTLGLHRGQLH